MLLATPESEPHQAPTPVLDFRNAVARVNDQGAVACYRAVVELGVVGENQHAIGRSEVLLYRPTIGFKKIVNSFKQWVAGEDAGCPKMK